MGQANQRGTRAERVAMAKQRNRQLVAKLYERPADNAKLIEMANANPQRLATRLVAAGLIGVPKFVVNSH